MGIDSDASSMPRRMGDPSRLLGSRSRRVFIGGSYHPSQRSVLQDVSALVTEAGLVPVLADLFQLENEEYDIHSTTMALLHNCKYAIFELTLLSGALMEVERLPDYGTRALVLYADPDNKGYMVSRMLSSFLKEHEPSIDVTAYVDIAKAREKIVQWLHELDKGADS